MSSSALQQPLTFPPPLPPSTSQTFSFPPHAAFPPFYTLQPNLQTRARQLDLWASLIQTYCAHHHIFRLSLSSPPSSLFANTAHTRTLKPADIRTVLDYMAKAENGARIEWLPAGNKGEQSSACYVYWRLLGEWADVVYAWVEETGQKGSVLTVYELREGDAVRGKEWRDMDEGMLRKVLAVLVKRGKAQVFAGQGGDGGEGVKFF